MSKDDIPNANRSQQHLANDRTFLAWIRTMCSTCWAWIHHRKVQFLYGRALTDNSKQPRFVATSYNNKTAIFFIFVNISYFRLNLHHRSSLFLIVAC